MNKKALINPAHAGQHIEGKILLIRGHKVILDADLARLYGVQTKALNKAVRRNIERFPEGFMLQLTRQEHQLLRFQIGTLENGRGKYSKYLPMAFTEQGVAMLSSVLRSKRAIQVNIAIMKTFVKIRELLTTHRDLAHKLEALERKYEGHDAQFKIVFDAIRKLIGPPHRSQRRIGFQP